MRLSTKSAFAAVAALSVLALAACGTSDPNSTATPSGTPSAVPSSSASPSASPTPKPVEPSKDLSALKASGAYGKEPKVEFKAPWGITETQTKVLVEGKGAKVAAAGPVEVSYYGVNARTGKMFDESFSSGKPIAFDVDQVIAGFKKGLVGQKQGSRVLIAMPGKDGYDASGGTQDGSIQVGDTLIFVVDIVNLPLTGPEGKAVKPAAGLPTVADKGGKPEITIPKSDPPKKLQSQTLIEGTGKKIAETDQVTINYRWVAWKDGRLLEETYGDKPATTALSGLLPGMVKGLAGKTVGSRVLLVVPPDQGYPDGNDKPKIEKGETLVLVVDLLFSQAGQ
ncbi:FKBP-type peptidyl-prolyl cis-trans isomerase [Microlunatus sp. GCM10028923]|uniref:FKBP-type peptidyl-prolyl cis-trans isomerase n=1 Tax=Microlunatus sp. GCM10028923 TaxID=3273400 RepID=UPI00361A10CB